MTIRIEDLLGYETDRIEWKQSLKQTEEIYRAVCALANDLRGTGEPGHLVLGVTKSGEPIGLGLSGTEIDEEQQILSNRLRSTKLLPTPAFDIAVMQHAGALLFLVRVDPYDVPPVVQVDGVTYVRSSSTTVKATPADIARLNERRPEGRQPFDYRLVRSATIGDLDTRALKALFDAARDDDGEPETFPTFADWLTQLELGRVVDDCFRPNTTAVLVFGRSPQSWLPGAVVEFVRYGGSDVEAPVVARKTITGTVPDQMESTWAQIEQRIEDVPRDVKGIRESFAPSYPPDALKELVRNLLQHRQYEATHAPGRIEWYDDRVEFSNPGAPFGRASAGEFGEESDYRNPTLTKHLVDLGYVQKLGRGVRIVRRQLARNGNPPLEVEIDGFTRVKVRRLS